MEGCHLHTAVVRGKSSAGAVEEIIVVVVVEDVRLVEIEDVLIAGSHRLPRQRALERQFTGSREDGLRSGGHGIVTLCEEGDGLAHQTAGLADRFSRYGDEIRDVRLHLLRILEVDRIGILAVVPGYPKVFSGVVRITEPVERLIASHDA